MTVSETHTSSEKEEYFLQQWQTCVEMANSVSQRRDTMNNLFVTVNLAVFTAVSVIWDVKSIILSAAGIAVCVVWPLFINNFKLLNKAKFEVITEIEKQLPYRPFTKEWDALNKSKRYRDGTALEKVLPGAFIAIYAALILLICLSKGGVTA